MKIRGVIETRRDVRFIVEEEGFRRIVKIPKDEPEFNSKLEELGAMETYRKHRRIIERMRRIVGLK